MDSELEVGKGGGAGEESLGIPQGGTERARGLAGVIDGALGTDSFSAAHPPQLPPVPRLFLGTPLQGGEMVCPKAIFPSVVLASLNSPWCL